MPQNYNNLWKYKTKKQGKWYIFRHFFSESADSGFPVPVFASSSKILTFALYFKNIRNGYF